MALELIGEKREGSGSIRSAGGIAILDVTFHYIVNSHDKDASRVAVLNTPGLPYVGETTDDSGYAICKSKNGDRRAEQPEIWDITCVFSSEVDDKQGNQNPQSDPEAWVPVYETKFERLQEVVTRDLSEVSIANSSGESFDNGLTIGRFIPVWEFYQIESASVSDETIIARNETINSGSFKGRAAETLLLTVMSSIIGFYYGQPRRLTQYSLKYNKRKWTHKRLDVGVTYLDDGVRKSYLDDGDPDAEPPVEPQVIRGSLNGAGGKAAAGDPPATLLFDMYEQNSFSFLRT